MHVETLGAPVIVGTGLAGLSAAVQLFPSPCLVLGAGAVGEQTSTRLAQGGLAAAVGPDDSTELHLADTLAAGAGLCDEPAARSIVEEGPRTVEWLQRLGVRFDNDVRGRLDLGLEGAHRRRRVLHVDGDGSGAGLLQAMVQAARTMPSIELRPHTRVLRVLADHDGAQGLLVERHGQRQVLATRAVVLATGGLGGLFAHTTNPLGSQGQGLALAARAGAQLRDVEMAQFHPTALDVGIDPMPLVSEAVRGEGAVLVDEAGCQFVESLAPRDVVSRAVWQQLQQGRRVLLDARLVPNFAGHFAQVHGLCRQAGIDPARDLIPVRPAAHYHMGGIETGLDGSTSVPGLYAVGECASTGLHGANRLASNSLLEAVVMGRRVAGAVGQAAVDAPLGDGPLAARLATVAPMVDGPAPAPVRQLCESYAGILRSADGLHRLCRELEGFLDHDDALVAHLVATAALQRRESRGAHQRTDHPATADVAEHTRVSTNSAHQMEDAQ